MLLRTLDMRDNEEPEVATHLRLIPSRDAGANQYAPRPNNTVGIVFRKITVSRSGDQRSA